MKQNQTERLFQYLRTGRSITPLIAGKVLGIERLAARMLELKRCSHACEAQLCTDVNGKRFTQYRIVCVDPEGGCAMETSGYSRKRARSSRSTVKV
jgi:hypothetical protein